MAMLVNAAALALYGFAQTVPFVRDHSPSIVQILRETESYLLESNSRLAYVGTWAAALLAVSSGLVVAIAYRAWPNKLLAKLFAKSLSDESVWHRYFFVEQPNDTYVYLECYLTDGRQTTDPLA